MKRSHRRILTDLLFEPAGTIAEVLVSNEFDDYRIVYAITDPSGKEIVYVGHSEVGRNLKGRLKAHLKARDKMGFIESNSKVYVHIMITETYVLNAFEEEIGTLPLLNRVKSCRHPKR